MTYHISLSTVAWFLAAWAALAGLALALTPSKAMAYLQSSARRFNHGLILWIIAVLWAAWLLSWVDMGDFSRFRWWMMIAILALGFLVPSQVPDFLFPRALGSLLVLGAEVLLSAALPVLTPWRLVVTLTAYAWALSGMTFVAAPYTYRDAIAWATRTPSRTRLLGITKLIFAALLATLAASLYP